jgi:hypothetical protein
LHWLSVVGKIVLTKIANGLVKMGFLRSYPAISNLLRGESVIIWMAFRGLDLLKYVLINVLVGYNLQFCTAKPYHT